MNPFEAVLRSAASDLDAIESRWAMVGGVAVSARSEPRFTRHVDVVVAVDDDHGAEAVVHRLTALGHTPREIVEHDYLGRLSTVRLAPPVSSVMVDLLFASSGIEAEIVAAASRLEVLPGLHVPVASTGHLIALKVLAGRHQDLTDLDALLTSATAEDLGVARQSVRLIGDRGFHREQDLVTLVENAIARGT